MNCCPNQSAVSQLDRVTMHRLQSYALSAAAHLALSTDTVQVKTTWFNCHGARLKLAWCNLTDFLDVDRLLHPKQNDNIIRKVILKCCMPVGNVHIRRLGLGLGRDGAYKFHGLRMHRLTQWAFKQDNKYQNIILIFYILPFFPAYTRCVYVGLNLAKIVEKNFVQMFA